ncbi:PEGA domain-containing protein [Hyalangium versicolor]|uniref:PEGA domain-containing protein n=1 Tax=Hyalangium versicolor TaxID=2861190 RepID=UPI001CCD2DE5|nr:PEGA domain-containing protein [Hyalangium versicolor]
MHFSRAFVCALAVALVAPQAFAQDDLIVPINNEPKSKSKATKRRTPPKKATAKKAEPAPEEDDLVVPISNSNGKKSTPSKPATAKKTEPAPAALEDELVIPIAAGKTELAVKLSGGLKGARLYVDSKDMGPLPQSAPLPITAGEHTVVVRRIGFADFNRRITVAQGKPTEVAVTLEAVAGVMTVTADVAGASVSINGQVRGQVPLANLVLKPGSYEIVVSKDGFLPETKSLSVKAGKEYTVAANLRPSDKPTAVASTDRPERPVLTPSESVSKTPVVPLSEDEPEVSTSSPWYKRWYVWAGVGVVAAAAAGAVVATQSGGVKTLGSETVCGGPCDGTINGVVPRGAH